MNLENILIEVIDKLEELKIDYMVVGSFASNFYGVPRTTLDADILIQTDLNKISQFINTVKDDFYADLDMAIDALKERSSFNIINFKTGFKIDFIVLKDDSFSMHEFERRRKVNFLNKKVFIASLEDTIISKILWMKETNSEKQKEDVLGIIKVQKDNIDFGYLKKWAKELNIEDILKEIFKKSNIAL